MNANFECAVAELAPEPVAGWLSVPRQAASHAKPLHRVTPLLETRIAQFQVGLKLDNLQPARSFKLRGIGHLCQYHARNGIEHFVCSSAGNAGYAVAWAGRELGLAVTVVVPQTTPTYMRERIAALGASVVCEGEVWDDANDHAQSLALAPAAAFIPPFDHPLLWEGHASLVDELFAQRRSAPDAILLAVGGGGLLLGVLRGLARVGWSRTAVVAVEPQGAASLASSLHKGSVVDMEHPHSIATSLCVRHIAPALIAACRDRYVLPVTVSDAAASAACVRLAEDHGQLVEAACGVALAPLYESHAALAGFKDVVAVVCGGQVVTLQQIAGWREALVA